MPPRQVYGKRTKTAAASYSNFLSPDKDDELLGNGKRNATKKQNGKMEVDEVIAEVGERLEALTLGHKRDTTVGLMKEDVGKPTERKKGDGTAPGASRKVAVAVVVEQRSGSLRVPTEVVVIEEEKPKRGRTSRKALEARNPNARPRSERTAARTKERTAKATEHETKEEEMITNAENAGLDVVVREQTSADIYDQLRAATSKLSIADSQEPPESLPNPPTPERLATSLSEQKVNAEPSPMTLSNDTYTTYISPLLSLSEQRDVIPFEEWSSKVEACVDIEKIAEASFSEVYRLTMKRALPGCAGESVLKIVALKTPPDAPLPSECTDTDRTRRKGDIARQLKMEMEKRQEDDEWKSRVEDIACEVRLLQNLNHIPGFTNFRELTVLQGRPSSTLSRAWKAWNKSRPRGKKSEFPDPSKKTSYDDTQLWAVIEMQDAGTDCGKVMEAGGIGTIWEVWDVFWSVCLSVAKAEEGCRFEHRDLHMDNICIRSATEDASLTERRVRNPLKRKLGFTGLETTVIDYTLSRADIVNAGSRRSSSIWAESLASTSTDTDPGDAEVAYLDLNKDPTLFEGDADVEYQYEIYRYMRGIVFHNDALNQCTAVDSGTAPDYTPSTPRRSPRKYIDTPDCTPRRSPRKHEPPSSRAPAESIWKSFHPKTNLIWAHFILLSLLDNISDKSSTPSSLSTQEIMYNVDAKPADTERVVKKAGKLHKILLKVGSFLEPEALGRGSRMGSMRDLVVLALEAGWLGVDDVRGADC